MGHGLNYSTGNTHPSSVNIKTENKSPKTCLNNVLVQKSENAYTKLLQYTLEEGRKMKLNKKEKNGVNGRQPLFRRGRGELRHGGRRQSCYYCKINIGVLLLTS